MQVKSQDSVHKPQFLKRKESRSGSNRGSSAYQPNALPLGHTGSPTKKDAPSSVHALHFRHTRLHRCVQAYERTNFYSRPDVALRSRNSLKWVYMPCIYSQARWSYRRRFSFVVVVSLFCWALLNPLCCCCWFLTGATVYVWHKPTELAHPIFLILFLCLFLSLWPFQLYFIPYMHSSSVKCFSWHDVYQRHLSYLLVLIWNRMRPKVS